MTFDERVVLHRVGEPALKFRGPNHKEAHHTRSRLETERTQSHGTAKTIRDTRLSPLHAKHLDTAFPRGVQYRGTSLTRKHRPLGPYRRPVPRVLGGS